MTNLIDKVKEKTKKEQIVDLVEGDTNLFAQILKVGIEQLMEAERDDYIGVDRYDRSRARKTSRNGYKTRQLYTRVGKVVLRVPKTRDGEFYPAILNRYERSEKALVFALAESYVQGVSTRKMAAVTEELLGKQFSSQTISNFAQQLDAELDPWRNRSIEGYFPYVTVDARYEHCRRDGKIVDMAVLVAVGVNEDGKRHVLGVETGWGESEAVWKEFIAGLKARGLKAPLVFTSDAHPGIRRSNPSSLSRCRMAAVSISLYEELLREGAKAASRSM